MNLIQLIKRFLGITKPSGRPRIPIEKQLAIKGAPMHASDSELARMLSVSYATVHRYRRNHGQIQRDSPPTT